MKPATYQIDMMRKHAEDAAELEKGGDYIEAHSLWSKAHLLAKAMCKRKLEHWYFARKHFCASRIGG